MNKQLNILFLSSWYPNKLQPQNGNFIQEHALAVSLLSNVNVLHIIARDQEQLFDIEKHKNNEVFEVNVYYKKIKGNNLLHKLQKLKRRHAAYNLGYKAIIQWSGTIDLVHLNVAYPSGIFALYLKKKYRLKYIITEHWTGFLDISPLPFNNTQKKIIRRILDNASLICPVSDNLQSHIKKFTSNKDFSTVHNVVNSSLFHFSKITKEKKILHVSNLKDEHKNITGILNAVKNISEQRTDFHITIAGNGDTSRWIGYAESIEIPPHIYTIEGSKTREEVANLMQSHSVFLLNSNYENLPCVIAEAHCCGLPVLATNVGGINEMIDKHNGILIPPGNQKILIEKLLFLLDNISNYNPVDISSTAVKKYSFETVGKQFIEHYQNILEKSE